MKIALIGYGKMGKEIEAVAASRGHSIVLKVRRENAGSVTGNELLNADVGIEFSTPDTVIGNIKKCMEAGLPLVVGTTGWYQQFDEISSYCRLKNAALFHATNFSPGVNLFFKLNTFLAQLMNSHPEYDVSMEEIHHIHKLDRPSGTAITLANQVISKIDRKKKWSTTDTTNQTLFIKDVREGEVPGTHIIKYHSEIDDIEIMHKAHNRRGFALGAVIAAEFLIGKKGIYTMEDLF
jgi:4-hydroxy-tetrahydrodipicolinate reductase